MKDAKPKARRTPAPFPLACQPALYELADLSAVQALANGKANSLQQQRALRWIIESAADTYGLGWHPGSAHDAAFVAGRRFAGLQIVKALKINTAAMRKATENELA